MISVVLPTRNPHAGRLDRTLRGLAAQSLDPSQWEVILVDNASDCIWEPDAALTARLPGLRRLREPAIGLTPARLCGIRAARGNVLVFVDDDNVLDRCYLEHALRILSRHPLLAAAGGPVVPEWEAPPPEWTREFHGLLALRDLGPAQRICTGGVTAPWPVFAPVGAGLVVRRAGALAYAEALAHAPVRRALDRRAGQLGSGGDNDLVFTLLRAGGEIGYFPELALLHLIPAGRLDARYLARLNRGIMRTWVTVLHLHGHCPWPPINPATVPLRAARAWLRLHAWRGPAERVRWAGARGQFEGQADLFRTA